MTKNLSPVNRADVAGAISSFYGVAADATAVDRLAALVYPDVKQASARDPAAWKSAMPGVLAKYESMARELGLGVSPTERDRAALKTANRTDAAYAAAAGRLGSDALRQYSGKSEGRERSAGRGDTALGSHGRDGGGLTSAISFTKELGISPGYANLFTGGSPEMRNALRDAIKSGKAITDDNVKSMKDVGMVLGAIRAGKLKPDDPRIPQSVRGVIEDMKKKGIDPTKADAKTIKKYLDENPKALETVRKEAKQEVEAKAGQSREAIDQERKKLVEKRVAAVGTPSPSKPKASSTL